MCRPNAAGLVAESDGNIAAVAIFSLEKAACVVHLFAAASCIRRLEGDDNAGGAVVAELTRQAAESDRLVRIDLPEDAVNLQLLLHRHGFVCERVVCGPRPGGAATYHFVWTAYRTLIARVR